MLEYTEIFSTSAKDFIYKTKVIHEKNSLRRSHSNVLFFDLILEQIANIPTEEIKGLYPPHSSADLQQLYKRIRDLDIDGLKKDCILYYLVKDGKNPTRESAYVKESALPENFRHLMDGYHALDNLEFEKALSALLYPSVEPNFVDKIIKTFFYMAPPEKSGYYTTVYVDVAQPPMESSEILMVRMKALLKMDTALAYDFIKQYTPNVAEGLLSDFVDSCLQNKSNAIDLFEIPFTETHEQYVIEYLAKGSKSTIAPSTLFAFLVVRNRLDEAISLKDTIDPVELRQPQGIISKAGIMAYIQKIVG